MAGASDKARFYLEQSVPELREWERREIFTKSEIAAIAGKRSDFEHVLNARGSKPSDYVRYAEYEMNLDSLRRKRVQRKGVKTTAHSVQRRIFFILDRGTKKFHGDIGLWMQYLDFARKQKSSKKIGRILTDVLRLHPTKPELWIYAARYAIDAQADITTARSYMQRGLRFCSRYQSIYIEYARLEMGYVAKIAARQYVLGLGSSKEKIDQPQSNEDDRNADMIVLPNIIQNEDEDVNVDTLTLADAKAVENLSSTPVMTGAIPMAIFDAGMEKFDNDEFFARDMFNLVIGFPQVPCTPKVLDHVLNRLKSTAKSSVVTLVCSAKLHLVGVASSSVDFPNALRRCLHDIKFSMDQYPQERRELAREYSVWLSQVLEEEKDLGPELEVVIKSRLRQLSQDVQEVRSTT